MSVTAGLDYLEDGFSASSVTMLRLRQILFENGIVLPSTARKADLVDAFGVHIVPQREKLRRRKLKDGSAKADGTGIQDMRDGADGVHTIAASPAAYSKRRQTVNEGGSESESGTTESRISMDRPRGRKGSRVASAAKDIDHPASSPSRKSPTRSRSSSPRKREKPNEPKSILSNISDREDSGSDKKKMKSQSVKRRTSVTFNPDIKYHDDDGDISNFSTANPFQSGSPAPGSGTMPRKSAPARVRAGGTPAHSPRAAAPGIETSSSSSSASAVKALPVLRNFMDPLIAASTPPRAVGQVVRRIVSAGSAVAGSVTGRVSPAEASEEETGEEDDEGGDEYQDEEDDAAGGGAEDSMATTVDSSFDVNTDPSPSIHALREKRKRQGGRSSLSHETTNLWKGDSPMNSKSRRGGHSVFSHAGKNTRGAAAARAEERWARLQRLGLCFIALYSLFVFYVATLETRTIGFCDTGSNTNSALASQQALRQAAQAAAHGTGGGLNQEGDDQLLNVTLSSFVPDRWLPQTCTPCPAHADCRDGAFVRCSTSDFLLSASLTSKVPVLRSFAPLSWLAPTCMPDTHKLVLALELGSELERVLADWHGQVLCGYQSPHEAIADGKLSAAKDREEAGALPAVLLKADLHARMDRDMVDDEYFEQLWTMALGEYEKSSEVKRLRPTFNSTARGAVGAVLGEESSVSVLVDNDEQDLLYAPRAIMSLSCSVSLRVHSFLRRFRLFGLLLVALLGLLDWTRRHWAQRASESKRIAELVQIALEHLQEQEYNHAVHPVLHPEPFLATAQLRDHVLASEHSTKARKRLWAKVSRVVEENANVRTRQAQRRGEWARVWEWIGGGAGTCAQRSGAASPVPIPSVAASAAAVPEMAEKKSG
ncbi:hypothetical protein K437DRAFT_255393 [Tilletiaria anomala UBC 951]|uniref:Man1/Src1 C-terminal domain-containing protein n=1 Tax=Tilletiaria anomala (strain ATCC 24038 / CBS 436.72 / UBC 951) TaxID=1037660 RepID=A0A066WDN3_TILAU|nr:uncharacterized protein K437DRAFT_255393 [Tilletiaria anomala UBC 951]KDN48845.1 hypothetical protein K437DRAFT_255393 [Tilletiaria anomala UBC 951]